MLEKALISYDWVADEDVTLGSSSLKRAAI